MNEDRVALRSKLKQCVYKGGEMILAAFGGGFKISEKEGINNLVTEVDQAVEKTVTGMILADFPEHFILGEEYRSERPEAAQYLWILDPIDGTVNFAHGIPLCCISLALLHNDELILGAVYNPMMDEFFFAEKGAGATLNGEPIRVSSKSDFSHACLVTGFPYVWNEGDGPHPVDVFGHFVKQGLPIRRLGSAALDLCWVAAGRFDGFWEYNLSPWDIAAGYLLVAEAGGKITNFSGAPATVFDRQTLATNGRIHAPMQAQIQSLFDPYFSGKTNG